jgi:hypothetical protein
MVLCVFHFMFWLGFMLFVSESYFEKFFDVKFGIEAAFTLCVWTMIIVSTNVVVHNKCQNAFIFFIL